MLARKPPKGLLKDEAQQFTLSDAVFLCALAERGGRAVGVCLGVADVNAETLSQSVHHIRLELNEARLQWKVVGRPTLVRWCEDYLRQVGETVAKAVAREESAEVMFFPQDGRLLVTKAATIPARVEASKKIVRVLIIDDSPTIHTLLKKMLADDSTIEVVGLIQDPREAEEAIARLKPDVITLDIHMPHMDGVALLKRYLPRHRVPTIMISALSQEDGPYVLDALENGAFDYIRKPSLAEMATTKALLLERIHAAANANLSAVTRKNEAVLHAEAGLDLGRIIGIGSSTGGTEALRNILTRLPEKVPPILIVQHIPPVFSHAFATRMNTLCRFRVKEAEDGDVVVASTAFIAPGGKQMRIEPAGGGGYRIRIEDTEPVNRHKPSVDVLFNSMAEHIGAPCVGVILTGMGNDGARGLLKMKQRGAQTIGQDQATSVVYGMPREAAQIGAVDDVLPLGDIAARILQLASKPLKKAS